MTIGVKGNYGIGLYVPMSGFFRKDPVMVLVKQCNTCQAWKPETPEFFYHDGKEPRIAGWRSEGYCKACRALKESMARSSNAAKQDRSGNVQKLRQEYLEGKRTTQTVPKLNLIATFDEGLDFAKALTQRDPTEIKDFINLCVVMVDSYLNEGSLTAKEWLDAHRASVPEELQQRMNATVFEHDHD